MRQILGTVTLFRHCDGRKLGVMRVLAVMHCKALWCRARHVKVKNEVTLQREVLEKIGADLVILPEVEAGMSLAKMILSPTRD